MKSTRKLSVQERFERIPESNLLRPHTPKDRHETLKDLAAGFALLGLIAVGTHVYLDDSPDRKPESRDHYLPMID